MIAFVVCKGDDPRKCESVLVCDSLREAFEKKAELGGGEEYFVKRTIL